MGPVGLRCSGVGHPGGVRSPSYGVAMPTRDGRGLAGESLVYAIGLSLQRGLSVLVLPIATRVLAPDEVGVAAVALAVAGLLTIVLGLGFGSAVVRLFLDEADDGGPAHWAMLVWIQVALAAAIAALVWASGPLWSDAFSGVGWAGALQAAIVLSLAQAVQATLLGVLRAARRIAAFSSVVVVQVVLGALAAWALMVRYDAAGLVGGLALGALAAAVVAAALTSRRPAWSWPRVRAGLLFSVPLVAHLLATWVMNLSDRLLIERFIDLDALASYSVAYAIGNLPILLTDGVQSAWVPRFYGLDPEVKRSLPARLTLPVTLVVVAAAAAVMVVAPVGARILAPADFDVPLVVTALVVAATFVRAAYLIAFGVLSDVRDSRSVARASMAGATLNIGANLVVIPLWGLNGAAATTLAGFALMSVLAVRRAERHTGAAVGLANLALVWLAGSAVMLALAALPTTVLGWALRAIVALVAVAAGRSAFGAARAAYGLTVAERSGSPPSTP